MFLKASLSVFLLLASPILSAQIADRSFRTLERQRIGEEGMETRTFNKDIESQDQDTNEAKVETQFDKLYIYYIPVGGILLVGVLLYTCSIPKYLFTIGKDPQAFGEKQADDRIETGEKEFYNLP